jgi:dTMP kinase
VRPLFLTFEGLDGSGKSTHLGRLERQLASAGIASRVTHEPGGTPLGEGIRRLFLGTAAGTPERERELPLDGATEVLLVFASRRQHLLEVIEPALAAGIHVLCDRFTDSTYAYQGAGRGVPLDLIDRVDEIATGRRAPDRTLLFDLEPEEAHRRSQSKRRHREGTVNRLDREGLEFYRRVRAGYLERAHRDPERFRVVYSGAAAEETARQVVAALVDVLPTVGELAAGSTAGREEASADRSPSSVPETW